MDFGDEPSEDPFASVSFDEDFVRSARAHEPSAEQRAAAARAARADLQRQRRQLRQTASAPARFVRTLRSQWKRLLVVVGLLVVIGLMAWTERSRSNENQAAGWSSAGQDVAQVGDGASPTPRPALSDEPLGSPVEPVVDGSHTFMAYQPDSEEPVAYDPCRPIQVVINHRRSPPDGGRMITESLDEISRLTGLQFNIEGATDEVPTSSRSAFQPERYGDRWAPVLIAWSDPGELARLQGPVAGLGGSAQLARDDLPVDVYVSGSVTLDGPQLTDMLARVGGWEQARSVVLHELGHLVGLGHVKDPTQLMFGQGHPGIIEFQDGDKAGLARLGQGECVPEL